MDFSTLLVSVDVVIGKYNYDTRTHTLPSTSSEFSCKYDSENGVLFNNA